MIKIYFLRNNRLKSRVVNKLTTARQRHRGIKPIGVDLNVSFRIHFYPDFEDTFL
jgi:hypothetical protein